MPSFSYKARDGFGKPVKGVMLAEDEDDLVERLNKAGYYLTRVSQKPISAGAGVRGISRKELIVFTIHLSTLISAGVPIVDGLYDLSEQVHSESLRWLLDSIRFRIQAGSTLAEALEAQPATFSELYVNTVRAGEEMGKLGEVLNRLTVYLEWQQELTTNIRQASIYPVILLTLICGVGILIFTFVLPRFAPLFIKAGIPLPLPTRILLGIGNFTRTYWYCFVGGLFALFVIAKLYIRTPLGRLRFDKLKLELPIFGDLIRKIALSRFAHTLASLVRTGVDILRSLSVVERVVGNAVLARAIRNANDSVLSGKDIASSLEASGEFPPLVVRMIAVGEQSGALSMTLDKVCDFYDREVTFGVKRLFSILEPLVIVFMGAMVAVLALSVFLPLYQMMSLINR